MAAVVIIAFINITLIALLIKSIYSAIRYKKGFIFKTSSWIKNNLSRIYGIGTKTHLRKYLSLIIIFGFIIGYTLQQKGIIGLHIFN